MALLSISNVVSAVIVVYIAVALQQVIWIYDCDASSAHVLSLRLEQLYHLVNPLNGVDIPSSGLEPLWKEKQKYSILCFLSQQRKLKTM